MKTLGTHNYYVYVLTNKNKTVLYVGVTNNLSVRLFQHRDLNSSKYSFTKRYKCFYLLYFELFHEVDQAISREKQIKGWSRKKKEDLINEYNFDWRFLNDEL